MSLPIVVIGTQIELVEPADGDQHIFVLHRSARLGLPKERKREKKSPSIKSNQIRTTRMSPNHIMNTFLLIKGEEKATN